MIAISVMFFQDLLIVPLTKAIRLHQEQSIAASYHSKISMVYVLPAEKASSKAVTYLAQC